jgi:hypothetical protein
MIMRASPVTDHRIRALLERLDPAGGVCTVAGCVHHPAPRSADGAR